MVSMMNHSTRTGHHPLLLAQLQRVIDQSPYWNRDRLLDEGLDMLRDACWADSVVLYTYDQGNFVAAACRPKAPAYVPGIAPSDWFPWGLSQVRPSRFLFIEDAGALAVYPRPDTGYSTMYRLEEFGIATCLHLPLNEREQPVGALQIFWSSPQQEWDDDLGRLLRTIGHYLLTNYATHTPVHQ